MRNWRPCLISCLQELVSRYGISSEMVSALSIANFSGIEQTDGISISALTNGAALWSS
jgi:hypothetical protein